MKIEALVQRNSDIKQFTKIFTYEESNKLIFFESSKLIKRYFLNNMLLKINERLELFVAYITTFLNEDKPFNGIGQHTQRLLSSHQVVLSIFKNLQKLRFTVTTNNAARKLMFIMLPILISRFFLYEQYTKSEVMYFVD